MCLIERFTEYIVSYCLSNNYLTDQQIPWFRYGLEKRIITILITIPFLCFGFVISNIPVTISFYASFSMLRSRTNGVHARTRMACLFFSILSEVLFLAIIPYNQNSLLTNILLFVSMLTIWIYAPFRPADFELTDYEVNECAIIARKRLLVLLSIYSIARILQLYNIAKGIFMGILLTASLLVLAYIIKRGGTRNGENKIVNRKTGQVHCLSHRR